MKSGGWRASGKSIAIPRFEGFTHGSCYVALHGVKVLHTESESTNEKNEGLEEHRTLSGLY